MNVKKKHEGVALVSTGIKTCNGSLRTAVRFRAPPPKNL